MGSGAKSATWGGPKEKLTETEALNRVLQQLWSWHIHSVPESQKAAQTSLVWLATLFVRGLAVGKKCDAIGGWLSWISFTSQMGLGSNVWVRSLLLSLLLLLLLLLLLPSRVCNQHHYRALQSVAKFAWNPYYSSLGLPQSVVIISAQFRDQQVWFIRSWVGGYGYVMIGLPVWLWVLGRISWALQGLRGSKVGKHQLKH